MKKTKENPMKCSVIHVCHMWFIEMNKMRIKYQHKGDRRPLEENHYVNIFLNVILGKTKIIYHSTDVVPNRLR